MIKLQRGYIISDRVIAILHKFWCEPLKYLWGKVRYIVRWWDWWLYNRFYRSIIPFKDTFTRDWESIFFHANYLKHTIRFQWSSQQCNEVTDVKAYQSILSIDKGEEGLSVILSIILKHSRKRTSHSWLKTNKINNLR